MGRRIMILLGLVLGAGVWLIGAVFIAAKQNRDATKAAEEAKVRAEAEKEAKQEKLKAGPKKYQPLGNKMKKPVFLPTEADSLLDEDPVVEWQPVSLVDDEGVIDWEKTQANAVYMNPATGELIEYGHK